MTESKPTKNNRLHEENNHDTDKLLLSLADKNPELVFTADDGYSYLRYLQKIKKELETKGLSPKMSQPKLNGKRQKGYRLTKPQEAPQATINDANDL